MCWPPIVVAHLATQEALDAGAAEAGPTTAAIMVSETAAAPTSLITLPFIYITFLCFILRCPRFVGAMLQGKLEDLVKTLWGGCEDNRAPVAINALTQETGQG